MTPSSLGWLCGARACSTSGSGVPPPRRLRSCNGAAGESTPRTLLTSGKLTEKCPVRRIAARGIVPSPNVPWRWAIGGPAHVVKGRWLTASGIHCGSATPPRPACTCAAPPLGADGRRAVLGARTRGLIESRRGPTQAYNGSRVRRRSCASCPPPSSDGAAEVESRAHGLPQSPASWLLNDCAR